MSDITLQQTREVLAPLGMVVEPSPAGYFILSADRHDTLAVVQNLPEFVKLARAYAKQQVGNKEAA